MMIISQPASMHMPAARSLVTMPPVPSSVPASPARARISGVRRSTRGISRAAGSFRGSAV